MSKIDAFKGGNPIWHMHPLRFLKCIERPLKVTREMLREIWTDNIKVPDSILDSVSEELTLSFETSKIDTRNRLYHLIAQVFQEVGPSFNLIENFNYRPNVLKAKFAYYKLHPSEADDDGFIPNQQSAKPQNIENKAYADRTSNGSFESGDGWKYRGRGMKQLTFRGNYRSFTQYHAEKWGGDLDFESDPDLLLEAKYATRSALFFWDHNSLPELADKGVTKKISYSITAIVNKYDDHYDDRFNNLNNFLSKRVFDALF
ncbi:hypothetical protein [Pantoea sp. GM01]|uniref:glycoside hydrolase family 19 protein n=1 Tax=Pantoea sp. GM01 TaxID=1144320 RepID=UPI0002712548|nr:hypothetical protein [Pantoea sp. GM01]EJL90828.1 putative chitinase [Pantoea sp. GM01]